MSINIVRFYKREKWKLDCEIVTPMFLGNANQEAELRAAPFKGLLRYWWRVANGAAYKTSTALLAAENKIFGSPDGNTGDKSQITVEVSPIAQMSPQKENFKNPGQVDHPECEKLKGKTNPLNYLAGMGLIHFKNGVLHSYFNPESKFQLIIVASKQKAQDVRSALDLFSQFGAIGSRSRNGWGCFAFKDWPDVSRYPLRLLTEAFDRDYPHCLGKDEKGALFWKTMQARSNWENCMKDLAEIYISIRAGNKQLHIPKLEVNVGSPPDRHLLGYPITNHNKVWGPQSRHGSALRLIVRKEPKGHRGYILHLPHLFSRKMWPDDEKERQIDIWKKVHANLDKLCQRVSLVEVQS